MELDRDAESDECFVVAPIGEEGTETRAHSDTVLRAIIGPAAKRCGLRTVRADAIAEPGNITEQIIRHLIDARLVVADLTDRNPNVFYELAVRHSFGLPVVLVARSGERIPFDLSTERVAWLALDSGLDALQKYQGMLDEVEAMMRAALTSTHRSPVTRVVQAAAAALADDSAVAALDRLARSIEEWRAASDPSDITQEVRKLAREVGRIGTIVETAGTTGVSSLEQTPEQLRSLAMAREEIEGALDDGRTFLLATPILRLADYSWAGIEVNIRIASRDGRVLAPNEVLPAAEHYGLMPELGVAGLNEFLGAQHRWASSLLETAGGHRPYVSINVSESQLRSSAFTDRLQAAASALSKLQVDLVIDIQESTLLQMSDLDILRWLTRQGIDLAVDDFGTGFSSLTHLRLMPLTYLKIDRSFVAAVSSGENTTLVRTLIELGQSLGLVVVGEGVESDDDLRLLEEMGCDQAEGPFVGGQTALDDLSLSLRLKRS